MGSLAKESRLLVIDLINSDNHTSFGYDELVLSPPILNNVLVNNRNTTVVVTSADAFQLEGSENMYYNRLDLGVMFTGLTVTLGGLGVTDISGLLPELNATYGLGLTMDDFIPQAFPSNPTYPLRVTLVAAATSYAYIGQLDVLVQNIAPQLGDNLGVNVLRNLGSDDSTLQTAIDGVNNLADAVIRMNLARYKHDQFVRGLAEDVKNDALVAIQQALDISKIDDEVRALQASVTALQSVPAGVPSATQTQIDTNTSNIAALQGTTSTLQTKQTTDETNIAALRSDVDTLKNATPTTPTRQTFVVSAPAGGVATQGEVAVANLFALLHLVSDNPGRIRLYATAAERDADASRSVLSDPAPGAGCLFEGTTTAGLLGWNCTPLTLLQNNDSPLAAKVYYTLEPASAAITTFTFTYWILEP